MGIKRDMAEDFDVEAMLEAPYRKGEDGSAKSRENGTSSSHKSSGKSKRRSRSRSREKERHRGDKDKHRDDRRRSKDRDRERDRERGDRGDRGERNRERGDRDRDRERGDRERDRERGDRERDREREKDKERERRDKERDKKHRSRSKSRSRSRGRERRRKRSLTPILLPRMRERSPVDELTPEERDARTVFCMQLSQRIQARDLEEFFSSVGKVRDVKLIKCNKTRRFKGIAYVEFKDPESVPLAMGLAGQKLLGVPIIVQPTQAEKNRAGNNMPNLVPKGAPGPMRLYVGSLHFNITEDMLRAIFEPFGKIDNIQLIMDPETGRSKGYGFLTFHNAEDAKKALDQLNGFELAGRPMKVGNVTERSDTAQGTSLLDTDELDRTGIDLGATGRLLLMSKLAEGTGLEIPAPAAAALNLNGAAGLPMAPQPAPPIATQCFMLANMFDPLTETNPSWDIEIRDDVIEECNKHGGVLHVYVDKASPTGNVYVKCPSIATAVAAVNSLHGRWFAGRMITAAYVPLINYHSLFPDTITALQLLTPTNRRPL